MRVFVRELGDETIAMGPAGEAIFTALTALAENDDAGAQQLGVVDARGALACAAIPPADSHAAPRRARA